MIDAPAIHSASEPIDSADSSSDTMAIRMYQLMAGHRPFSQRNALHGLSCLYLASKIECRRQKSMTNKQGKPHTHGEEVN
jgi:hypothetical protein